LGYKHTEETLAKLRARIRTPEHKAKLQEHLAKLNASPFPAETRARISAGMAPLLKYGGVN